MRQKIFGCLIALSTLTFLGCDNKSAQEYIQSAKVQYQDNQTQGAIIDLKNAIALEPQNVEARKNLGLYYIEAGFFSEAEKELRKARELENEEAVVFAALVKAIYYQNDFDRLINLTDHFHSADKKVQSTVSLFTLLSKLKGEATEFHQALDFSQLIADDLLLARAFQAFSKGKPKEAQLLLSQFTDPQQEQIEKLIVTGLVYGQLGDFAKAIEALTAVVEQSPELYVVQFQLAEILIRAEQFDNASKRVNDLLRVNANSAYANLLKAQIEFQHENYQEAFSAAKTSVQNGIDSTLGNLIAGVSAYKTENLENAYLYLNRISKKLPPNHTANRLLAEIRIKLGYIENLSELLDTFSGSSEQELSLFENAAMAMFRQGDVEQAKKMFEKANTIEPDNAVNLLRAGLVKLSTNDPSGIQSLESAIAQDSSLDEAWSLLAQGYMENNNSAKALQTAQDWQNIDKPNGLALEAYLNLQLGHTTQARELLEKTLQLSPQHPGAMRFLMLLNAKDKRFDEARALAQTLVVENNFPGMQLQNVIDLINIAVEQNDLDSVERLFANLVLENKDKALSEVNAGLAMIYNHKNQPEKAIALLEKLTNQADLIILTTLGKTYEENGKPEKAFETYSKLVEAYPQDKRGWIRLITMLTKDNSYDLALQTAREAMALIPKDPQISILYVAALLRKGETRASQVALQALRDKNIDSPVFKRFDAELAMMAKDYAKAVPLLKDYYKVYPSFDTAKLLATSLANTGNAVEGGRYLEHELLKMSAAFKEVHYIAEYFASNDMDDRAAKHYQAILELNPEHFVTLNNYAAVLVKLNDLPQAVALSKKALTLEPSSPYAMDTLGWALLHQKNTTDALAYIRKANKALPENVEIKLHLIEAFIANEQSDDARRVIKKLKSLSVKNEQKLTRLKTMLNASNETVY
ncbi:MAG: putative PEP-CTERM system TPR-repeat lipoprotein [Paraglaciecola sp.]|jgi:putative PEP-CTERM system TPR-repeat lipoprotein